MANEISVRTQFTFLDNDGTVYNKDVSFYSDASTTASRPRRIIFTASDAGLTSIMTFSSESFEQQPAGPSMVFIVNREAARDMEIEINSTSGYCSRILHPGEYVYLDVAQMDIVTLGGGGAFTYASDDIDVISCKTDFQSAKGEALIIFKAAS